MLLMCDSLIIFFSISPIISLYLSAVSSYVGYWAAFFFLGKSTIFFSRKINGKKINIFLAENQRENSAEKQRKKF